MKLLLYFVLVVFDSFFNKFIFLFPKRFFDSRWNGYLANISSSEFARDYECKLPESMLGSEFLAKYGEHVDPASTIRPDHVYLIRANTKYGVLEHHRVSLFSALLSSDAPSRNSLLGSLMFDSHYAYTQCGLGEQQTDLLVELGNQKYLLFIHFSQSFSSSSTM